MVLIARRSGPCHLVIYENLCADPHGETTALFEFLGWKLGQATRTFIDASVAGSRTPRGSRKNFFSVYRDPATCVQAWRKQLTQSQVSEIRATMRGSPLAHLWPDLAGTDS